MYESEADRRIRLFAYAMHEAAHAVAAFRFGFPIREVRIALSPYSDTGVELLEPPKFGYRSHEEDTATAARYAVMLYAGSIAQKEMSQFWHQINESNDIDEAKRLSIAVCNGDENESYHWRIERKKEAANFVQREHNAISSLAKILFEDGYLTGEEVTEALSGIF